MKKKTFIVQLLDSKKPSRTSFTQVEDANFYSNDTDASLVFIPHEETFDFQSAKVVMFNRGDESLVERDMEVTIEDGRKVASYELPDEIIAHWGQWVAQPVFISSGEIYSGAIVTFSVGRYLMDDRPPTLRDIIKLDELYSQLVTVMDEIAGKDVISAPEIILARGGEDTLGERLDKERNEVTTQLAQKVGGGKRASLNDLNEEVLNAIEGGEGTTFNLESIPSDYSVTPKKTTFVEQTKNLFIGDITKGYLDPTAGSFSQNEGQEDDNCSILELKPNTTYTISKTPTRAFRVGLSSVPILPGVTTDIVFSDPTETTFTFTTNDTQRYVIIYFGGGNSTPDFMQVEEGSEATEPEKLDYHYILKDVATEKIVDESVTPEKTTFIEKSKNLFDGEYRVLYMGSGGTYNEGTSGDDRGIILELEPNTDYTISKTDSSAFRVGFSQTKPEISGACDKFVFDDRDANEFSFKTDSVNVYLIAYVGGTKVPDFVQVEKGTEATEWFTYGNKLKNEAVPYFLRKDTENPNYYGIKGDGITDDTKALKDYAEYLRVSGGGVLELPPNSNILFTETISIPSNVLVRGNMSTLTLGDDYVLDSRIFRGNPLIFPYITTDTNSTDIHFENLTIKGNKNDFRNQRHSGLSFIDTERASATNVNVYEINYNLELAETYGTMAYNISTVRAKDVYIYGGTFDKGGYECVGVEQSEGVTIDNIRSGRGFRTSLQIHRDSQNIKVLNSTIRQVTDTDDAGAVTLHGQDDVGQGLKNIQLIGNTISGNFSSEPRRGYNALIQIMDGGTAEDILVKDNILKGNRTGIYGTRTKNFSVIGNNLKIEKGNGIHVFGDSINVLIDQNIVEVMDGIALSGSIELATLGTNIGL